MNELNNLVNEYNNLYQLSNFSIPTNLESLNPLKDQYMDSHTDNFLFDNLNVPMFQTQYNDKMTEVFDKINDFLIKRESFSTITDYIKNVANLKDTQSAYKFINDKNNTSLALLQDSNTIFMKWLFIFFFILSIIFQMFENMFLKSISLVSFIASIIVLLNIFKILNPLAFSIILLSLFSVSVIILFFKKMYIQSLIILLFGAIGCNFYMNYKGI